MHVNLFVYHMRCIKIYNLGDKTNNFNAKNKILKGRVFFYHFYNYYN